MSDNLGCANHIVSLFIDGSLVSFPFAKGSNPSNTNHARHGLILAHIDMKVSVRSTGFSQFLDGPLQRPSVRISFPSLATMIGKVSSSFKLDFCSQGVQTKVRLQVGDHAVQVSVDSTGVSVKVIVKTVFITNLNFHQIFGWHL